jgi:predicted PurR-regulated permease PerM
MSPQPVEGRLRITTRSIVIAVVVVAAAVFALRIVSRSERVIGWVLVAGAAAGVVHPAIQTLSRVMRRGLAIVVVALVTLGGAGFITYLVIDGVLRETRALQDAAPRLAAEIETSGRFGDAARQFDLAEKTRRTVADIPNRLTGGTGGVLRSAADSVLTVSIVGILAVFFLIQGPQIVRGAARQLPDPVQRERAEQALPAALKRGFAYVRRTLLVAAVAGLLTFVLAAVAGLPAPTPLALWVTLWSVLPLGGVIIGGALVIGLGFVQSTTIGVLLLLAYVAMQAADATVRLFWIERHTVQVGPFLALLAVFAGFEWRSVAGALLALLFVAAGAALIEELRPA